MRAEGGSRYSEGVRSVIILGNVTTDLGRGGPRAGLPQADQTSGIEGF